MYKPAAPIYYILPFIVCNSSSTNIFCGIFKFSAKIANPSFFCSLYLYKSQCIESLLIVLAGDWHNENESTEVKRNKT